jgi:hypothetical protein
MSRSAARRRAWPASLVPLALAALLVVSRVAACRSRRAERLGGRGATAWVVANSHPALMDDVAALSARLSIWGRPEIRAAFDRLLRVIAHRTEASTSQIKNMSLASYGR